MINEILANANAFEHFIHNLYEKSPIYPKYISGKKDNLVYASTIIRLKHEGVWYKQHYVETAISKDEQTVINWLIQKVYVGLLFTKVQPDLENLNGEKLWKKDKSQISEKERLLGIK